MWVGFATPLSFLPSVHFVHDPIGVPVSDPSDKPLPFSANGPWDLIAACAFGLEAIVKRELADLGVEASISESGRVHFRGDASTIARANLWLRTADRILLRVAEFPADDFDTLFETTRDIQWSTLLPADAAFPVTGRSIKSQLSSVPACQRTIKRAIVDAMKRDHATEQLDETGSQFKIDIALLKDTATLTIDTTGRSLHRRGYRTDVSRAPLKETLAAALVMLSYWKPDRPLVDPFCGSGTIPIEAARIAQNMAPGLDREFSCEAWPMFHNELLPDLRQAAIEAQTPAPEERIIGRDIDGRALQAARDNATRAGVEDCIHFQQGAMSDLTSKRRFGCIVTNPPYGMRVSGTFWPRKGTEGRTERRPDDRTGSNDDRRPQGPSLREREELDALYGSFPDVFRMLPTWSHYIFTAYPPLERVLGRKADRRRKLYNGRIECTYYQFHGPKPVHETKVVETKADVETTSASSDVSSEVSGPTEATETKTVTYVHADGEAAFGGLNDKALHQADLFATRLKKRAKHLRRWPAKRGITCFRLYERDVPELPFVVDHYDGHLHLTEYERPHDRDPARHASWLELMEKTAGEALGIPADKVFMKTRGRQSGKTQHQKVDETKQRFVVEEGGLKFLVNLADYIDTGLFLDHRVARQMVRDEVEGKAFLNLFAYTGSFTVYAAAGGARRTTSVDLSRTYLDWAWENMRLNGFAGNEHKYVTNDVGEWVREHQPGEMYDVVVFDPPTFSNSKRTENDWDVQRDAVPLLNDLLPLVRKGGVIYFSSNFRRFKFDEAALPVTQVHEISRQTVPEDFRNQRIHRCWRIVK